MFPLFLWATSVFRGPINLVMSGRRVKLRQCQAGEAVPTDRFADSGPGVISPVHYKFVTPKKRMVDLKIYRGFRLWSSQRNEGSDDRNHSGNCDGKPQASTSRYQVNEPLSSLAAGSIPVMGMILGSGPALLSC